MTKGKSYVTLRKMHFPGEIIAEIPFKQQAMEYVPKHFAPGDTSDGWHSLDDLYRHRTVLFASLCNYVQATNAEGRDVAFKSWKHSDGTMYDGMFLAGIWTRMGWVTYHCGAEFWGCFDVPELPNAPEWDGATPEDGIDRLCDEFMSQIGSGEV